MTHVSLLGSPMKRNGMMTDRDNCEINWTDDKIKFDDFTTGVSRYLIYKNIVPDMALVDIPAVEIIIILNLSVNLNEKFL